ATRSPYSRRLWLKTAISHLLTSLPSTTRFLQPHSQVVPVLPTTHQRVLLPTRLAMSSRAMQQPQRLPLMQVLQRQIFWQPAQQLSKTSPHLTARLHKPLPPTSPSLASQTLFL